MTRGRPAIYTEEESKQRRYERSYEYVKKRKEEDAEYKKRFAEYSRTYRQRRKAELERLRELEKNLNKENIKP